MRLHRLEMSAFGPFAGRQQIDFDELCDAGLFLLTGPTGAGKTTILDAVCFALYGTVPGVRGIKTLKSQHAADGARPEVVLDFSVRERRFVVRRAPEWSRPKRRGSGFTTENASATLVETTSGEEHLLSSRGQEVGHFIGDLIGMQSSQFVQVAMLPQGEFQRFLRASSQDRHDVLQHLFRTDRYARIEDWVHDHSRMLAAQSAALQQSVVRVLDTIAERVGAEVPDDLVGDARCSPEAASRVLAWARAAVSDAEATEKAARDQHLSAAASVAEARSRHAHAARLDELLRRRDEAEAALAVLAQDADSEAEARRRLEEADRSSRCRPLLQLLDEAADQRGVLDASWSRRAEHLAAEHLATKAGGDLLLPDAVTSEGLAGLERRARDRATRLEALLPRERELREARRALHGVESELAQASTAHARARERAAGIPAALADVQESLSAAALASGRAEALEIELKQGLRAHAAAEEAQVCASAIPALRDAERDTRDRVADARELMQELTARRLAGIAAELAGQLVKGRACQVCGSTEHPAPATAAERTVTDAEQQAASRAYDVAAAAHAAASGAVLQAVERLEGLQAAAGGHGVVEAAAEAARLSAALEAARRAQAGLGEARARQERLTREQLEVTTLLHDLEVQMASLSQAATTHRQAIDSVSEELAAEGDEQVSLADQVRALSALATAFGEARETLRDRDAAVARVEDLEARAHQAAVEHGFPDVSALRAAGIEAEDLVRLEEIVETRRRAAARAHAVLDHEDMLVVMGHEQPDLATLAVALGATEEQAAATARTLHQREECSASVRRQEQRLVEALTAWAPVRAEHLRAESMSKLVRGMGADNALQMRLSAYVLARRLDQVVSAANERLAHMRDQRYLLQRTGRAARKGTQAGLGLEVVDQWTGDVRDPATLSGGETFVVSLALALGLADVVTQESGGTEIETLFVDEGFGSLDADTLDDVMDRLDDLRAGGRAVGVVSHVSELRNRIPTQLHVEKQRTGSVVGVRTEVG